MGEDVVSIIGDHSLAPMRMALVISWKTRYLAQLYQNSRTRASSAWFPLTEHPAIAPTPELFEGRRDHRFGNDVLLKISGHHTSGQTPGGPLSNPDAFALMKTS